MNFLCPAFRAAAHTSSLPQTVQLRHRQLHDLAAEVHMEGCAGSDDYAMHVKFKQPVSGASLGQVAAVYDSTGVQCLGGGPIHSRMALSGETHTSNTIVNDW